jgi:hypothetical protein
MIQPAAVSMLQEEKADRSKSDDIMNRNFDRLKKPLIPDGAGIVKELEHDRCSDISILLLCLKCKLICRGIERMGDHLREEHDHQEVSISQAVHSLEPDRIIHTCDKCGKEYDSHMLMRRHRDINRHHQS